MGNLWAAGLLEKGPVTIGLAAMPVYFLALLAGWALFGRAGERTYRLVTFGLIVAAAILALPLWDGAFAGLAAIVG
jgi:hypothetical protein